MKVSFGFKIVIPPSELTKIQKEIEKEFSEVLLKDLNVFLNGLLIRFREKVKNDVRASPEYKSIISGSLQTELGLIDSLSMIEDVLDAWVGFFNHRITASLAKRGNLLFSIEFYYNAGDPEFSELLKIPAAKYSYISKSNLSRGSEVQIDWLEWLLIYGSQPQVQAQIVFNVPKFSRTGDAIMLATPGRWGWGVHPTYAGTPDDNFLTRSLSISRDWLIVELEKQAKARYG